MNDERRRLLTEWLGGCWHEWQNRVCDPNRKCETIPDCKKCGIICKYDGSTDNRTFDTWADLGAVKEKMVERGEWDKFYQYAYSRWKLTIVQPNSIFALVHLPQLEDVFTAWLFTPDRFCELAAEFLEGRK